MESYHDDNEKRTVTITMMDLVGLDDALASSGPHVFFLLLFFYIYCSHS